MAPKYFRWGDIVQSALSLILSPVVILRESLKAITLAGPTMPFILKAKSGLVTTSWYLEVEH